MGRFLLRGRQTRRWGLRTRLLTPIVVLVLISVATLGLTSDLSTRALTELLIRQRATSVLEGVAERLQERERVHDLLAELLASDRELSAIVIGSVLGGDALRSVKDQAAELALFHEGRLVSTTVTDSELLATVQEFPPGDGLEPLNAALRRFDTSTCEPRVGPWPTEACSWHSCPSATSKRSPGSETR